MKLISKITFQNMWKNKKRSILTIFSITLISALLFSIGFAFSIYLDHKRKTIIEQTGNYDVIFKVPYHQKEIILKNQDVEKILSIIQLGHITSDEIKWSNISLYNIKDYPKENLKIIGNYPQNQAEILVPQKFLISNHKKINDTITLTLEQEIKTFRITGYYQNKLILEKTTENDFFTVDDISPSKEAMIITKMKSKNHIYDKIFNLCEQLDLKYDWELGVGPFYHNAETNDALLELYGNFRNYGTFAVLFLLILLTMTLVSFISLFVIYNAFSISFNERKRMLGMLSSVGATPKQNVWMAILEATITCIGIPIGFGISLLITALVLNMINTLQAPLLEFPYTIYLFPLFFLMALIFILITIFLSAFFPAMRAYQLTPIEALRQSDDYKAKKKNKKNRIVRFLFHIEGDIAWKNMKRNKRKYQITTLSLFISLVFFMTLSTFIDMFQKVNNSNLNEMEKGISITMKVDQKDKIEELENIVPKQDVILYQENIAFIKDMNLNIMKDDALLQYQESKYGVFPMLGIKEELFKTFQKESDIILYDKNNILYKTDTVNYSFCELNQVKNEVENCQHKKTVTIVHELPKQIEQIFPNLTRTIIIPIEQYNKYPIKHLSEYLHIQILKPQSQEIDKKLTTFTSLHEMEYRNFDLENQNQNNYLLSIKYLLYIVLVFLFAIAILSVINTNIASIELRMQEFAILRSIGMTWKQLKKMLLLENFFWSIKAFFLALIVSIFNINIIHHILNLNEMTKKIKVFPTTYIIVSAVSVLLLMIIITNIAIKQIKKKNIIETIRKENT